MLLWHRRIVADASRNQQGFCHWRVAAGMHQKLENIIQYGGVGAAGLDHGLYILDEAVEAAGRQTRLVTFHPVAVAGDGVDLAIVRQHAERLRKAPGRERVRRIPLMVDRKPADEALVGQVGIEFRQMLRQEHALVDNRTAGQRADVQLGNLCRDRGLLDPPANDVEVALESCIVALRCIAHHDLLDLWPRRIGLLADAGDVDRHLTPAIDAIAELQDFGLDDLSAALLRGKIRLRQEHLADRDAPVLRALAAALDRLGKEILRNFDVDAGTVTGLAVRIDGPAMPHRPQGRDASSDNRASGHAVERGYQADAARIVLLVRVIGMLEKTCVCLPGLDEVRLCHGVDLQQGKRPSFLKKEAKNFCDVAAVFPSSTRANVQKFFGSFFQKRTASLLRRHSQLRPRRRCQVAMNLRRRIAPIAYRPDHQAGATHDVAGGEHAGQRGLERLMIDLQRSPPRHIQRILRPEFGQRFGIEAQGLDHQVGGHREMAPGDYFDRLPAGGIRQAETHAHGAHGGDVIIAQEGFRCRQPRELHALFLGVLHFPHAARHVRLVAAVEADDRRCALAHRRAHAIHRRVTAADDHNILAARIQQAGVEVRHVVAEALAVRCEQEIEATARSQAAPIRDPRCRAPRKPLSPPATHRAWRAGRQRSRHAPTSVLRWNLMPDC